MRRESARLKYIVMLMLASAGAFVASCSSGSSAERDFHTSGSREADQRAEQRVARDQQIRGESDDPDQAPKRSLYDRLGGETGIAKVVDDFVDRAIEDPRINFARSGISSGGVLGIGDDSQEWKPTTRNVAILKKHIAQFIALATGGPAQYDGKDMKDAHAGMKITNTQFDASVGDLKASLDLLGIPTQEQKELLAIVESTRPDIVEER